MTAVIINLLAGTAFVLALMRNRARAVQSLKVAWKMGVGMLPMLLLILLLIGLLFAFVSEDGLQRFLGEQSGPLGVLVAALVGSVLHIPSLLAFPLAASLLAKGASITVAASFITTLTMIGFVTLPLEIKELGTRFAVIRNGTSFVLALLISILMGLVI